MTKRELLQMALDVLNGMEQNYGNLWQVAQTPEELDEICNALRAELAKPEPEPVAWMVNSGEIWNTPTCPYINEVGVPLYRKEDL